jgi:NADH-quinone oxidoreductase subunit N
MGSLGALTQVKLKRFIGYTSIAQSSYIILGLSCNSLNGAIGSLVFLIMYCLISLSFFCILVNINHVSRQNNILYFNQLYSLILYNKEISFHLIIIILVMASIPPFSSFFVKLFIFIISIEAKLELLTIFFLGFTLISTFYYLNFIQQMIFFKYSEMKIFLFTGHSFLLYYLRSNSVFFCISYLYIPQIFEKVRTIIISCFWPLSF